MEPSIQLASLNKTFKCWKYLGIWPDGTHKSIYKYYSYALIFLILIMYNIALTMNLIYTPKNIELMIQELTFFFNIVAITTKIFIILSSKKTIIEILKTLECEEFQVKDEASNEILMQDIRSYKLYWNGIVGLGNFAFLFKSVVPIVANLTISSYQIQLPTSHYYFLDNKTKNDYFVLIFTYQCFGIYGLMMYDVTSDAFMNGIIYFLITQIKLLNYRLRNFRIEKRSELSTDSQEGIHDMKLKECLKHYDCILKYCNEIKNVTSVIMFIQYGMGSMVICISVCGLLLPLSIEALAFMISYLMGMTLQVFVPCWLGTELTHQSQELVFAAYNSDWIPRTESFKRSVKIFLEHAKIPIVMDGFKFFPLSLDTFTSIMKTAYSFLTLVRQFQMRENADN